MGRRARCRRQRGGDWPLAESDSHRYSQRGNFLQATLQDNAVGSFHVHPYIDCNNDNNFNATKNKEPFLTLNLVLIRVGGSIGATNSTNTSVAHPGNITANPAIGVASSATGVQFSSGNFVGPATAGVQNIATIVVVGGGAVGRLGLDNLFAGWVNNLTGMNIQASYRDTGAGVNHVQTALAVSNNPIPKSSFHPEPRERRPVALLRLSIYPFPCWIRRTLETKGRAAIGPWVPKGLLWGGSRGRRRRQLLCLTGASRAPIWPSVKLSAFKCGIAPVSALLPPRASSLGA